MNVGRCSVALTCALLVAPGAAAQTADKALLVVHTDEPYGLFVTPSWQNDPRQACGHGASRKIGDDHYLEIPDLVPANDSVRICFEQVERRGRFLSPAFVATPASDGVALVLIVRDQRVTLVRQSFLPRSYSGVWPAALGDCRFTGVRLKRLCFGIMASAGLSAQAVCTAESPFPAHAQRSLCFASFGARDSGGVPSPSELARIVAESTASMEDRHLALEQIRSRRLAVAAPSLLRVAQASPRSTERQLQIDAVLTLFELADARAPRAAKGLLLTASHDSRGEGLLSALGSLSDRASLRVLTDELSGGRPDAERAAALGLQQRREPEAEAALVEKFLRPETGSNTYNAILAYLLESGNDPAARALLTWAAPRRVVRDYVAGAFRGWIAARGAAVVGQLAAIAHDAAPPIARLASGFLERCMGHNESKPGAWAEWASQQPAAYWAAVSKDSACMLPGSPELGEPADGRRYLQVEQATGQMHLRGGRRPRPGEPTTWTDYEAKFKALERPLYPYLLAFEKGCFRLAQDQARNWSRHVGTHDYIAPGETFTAGSLATDFPALPPAPCSPAHWVPDDEREGALVFFVGEGKYRVMFRYELRSPPREDYMRPTRPGAGGARSQR